MDANKYIIVANKPGQLGNRLIVFANLIAYSIEHGFKIINPSFNDYKIYFQSTASLNNTTFPAESGTSRFSNFRLVYYQARLFDKLSIKSKKYSTIHLDWEDNIDLDDLSSVNIFSSRFNFFQGWKIRGNHLLEKYKSEIKAYFTPTSQYRQQLDRFIKTLPLSDDVLLLGVHIRRGDYANFENGKYFFSNEVYRDAMIEAGKLLSTDKKIIYVICSNEKTDTAFFTQNNLTVFSGPGSEILDLYFLTTCNYIIGPPSTYTMWASFYGDVPLFMMKEHLVPGTLNDFQIVTGF